MMRNRNEICELKNACLLYLARVDDGACAPDVDPLDDG